jgi:hypothetical protein
MRTILFATAACLALVSAAHAEPLPTAFLGVWDYTDLACRYGGTATITHNKIVRSGGEYPAGAIALVSRGGYGEDDTIVVSLRCTSDCNFVKNDTQVWHLFKIGAKSYMAHTSLRAKYTDIFERCQP